MNKEDAINKINNELKTYINETTFASLNCRNKMLRIFEDVFQVKLDISNYKNVDLKILDDFSISYRDDVYKLNEEISSVKELQEKYKEFKDRADKLIERKEINFENKKHINNIGNIISLLIAFLIILFFIRLIIRSLLVGDYYHLLWLLVFIVPTLVPRIKVELRNRIIQARNYLKELFKKK